MTIHVAGLGPGSASLLTAETVELLRSGASVIVRTRHHPTLDEIDPERTFASCDDLYESGASFDHIYSEIATRVVEAARGGDVVYAVPGHPLVAERSVQVLLAKAAAEGVEVTIHPAVSFADVAAVALKADFADVQLCDALDLRVDPERPALISQVYDRDVATRLKLQLLDLYPAEHGVVLLRSLGAQGAELREVPVAEIDHQPMGYLDSLFVPAIPPEEDVRQVEGLWHIIKRLNAPDGCPWDREQTHETLRPHLLEETYEALEAIDSGDPAKLVEELGDVLLQVLMHSAVAERTGEFSLGDVTEHIARKLIRRHPHVFGEATARTADEVYQNWEALKRAEKPEGGSILDGVPQSLPALAASQSIQGRARRVGFDWPDIEGPLEKLAEEVQEFARAEGAEEREDEFGDVLFVLANLAQRLGLDAEQALRRANAKFRRRFGTVEALAAERGIDLKDLDLAGLDALWDEAKALERGSPATL